MNEGRRSGILLHPTSLPGRWGIGDLGAAAYAFVDFLAGASQQLWQIMPLGPTGYGDSPYQSLSAFAGNPLLISPDRLRDEGWLAADDLSDAPAVAEAAPVDYSAVIGWKHQILQRAFRRFQTEASEHQRGAFTNFRAHNYAWLEDYSLFAALKEAHGGAQWSAWEPEIAHREPPALARWTRMLYEDLQFQAFIQFLFFDQWAPLKRYANGRGVQIVGDMPIFAAYDSADVWAHRDIFLLEDDGQLSVVAGAPPDFFSATGQRWGNVLYRWDVLQAQGYRWWIDRFRAMFHLVDILRLDHFRGFAAAWAVPAEEATAVNGRWIAGPGTALFAAAAQVLGPLPLIAEDLGLITPDVGELRDALGIPGMKILELAFSSQDENIHLPHHYPHRAVVYTSTHDMDTVAGWWWAATAHEHYHAQTYLGRDGQDISWDLIRLALASVADMAIIPLQDVLKLGSTARMNTPGQAEGNWSWRYPPDALDLSLVERLRSLTTLYGRRKP